MAKQLKGGYLLRYKKKLFWKGEWKEEWIILYENSNLVWYKNRDHPTPSGGILISDTPELLAVGLWTLRIPNRPIDLPNGFHTRQLIAIGTKGQEKVHWFLCKSEDEINEWMTAISNTLPAPPTRGQNKISYTSMNKSFDDVMGTPNHLRCKEILKYKHATELKHAHSLVDYKLPRQSTCSSSSSNAGTSSMNSRSPSINKIKGITPLRHCNSSGQLHSVDKMDAVAGTLAVGSALGVWSHGFGWGWGPGWGCNGWGSTNLSLSHPDFSSTVFRAQDYLPASSTYGADVGPSSYLHHYTNSTNAGDLFDSYGLDSSMGTGDDLSSAFDAFGGADFGF